MEGAKRISMQKLIASSVDQQINKAAHFEMIRNLACTQRLARADASVEDLAFSRAKQVKAVRNKRSALDALIANEEYEHFTASELEAEAEDQAFSSLWGEDDIAWQADDSCDDLHSASSDFKVANFEAALSAAAEIMQLIEA